jgi:hypothetical protein
VTNVVGERVEESWTVRCGVRGRGQFLGGARDLADLTGNTLQGDLEEPDWQDAYWGSNYLGCTSSRRSGIRAAFSMLD